MILSVFACRDTKAKAFLQPFFSNASGTAIRAFGDACDDEKSPFYKHPSDYILYEIGFYDDSTAELSSINPIKLLASASDFVKSGPVTPITQRPVTEDMMKIASVNGGK